MRGAIFVSTFAVLLIGAALAGSENMSFVLYISAAIAAMGATVLTESGRHALRRIGHNFTQGWPVRNSD